MIGAFVICSIESSPCTGASSPGLQTEEVVEDGADEIVVEEHARPGVPHQEGQDGESWQLGGQFKPV